MIRQRSRRWVLVGGSLLAGIGPSSGAHGAGVGDEAETFRRAVEAAFKKDQPVDRLLCQAPKKGQGLFGAFDTSVIKRVLVAPVSAHSLAFNEKDHFRRFDGAVYQLSICFEPPGRKEICIIRPVRRHDGALCTQ